MDVGTIVEWVALGATVVIAVDAWRRARRTEQETLFRKRWEIFEGPSEVIGSKAINLRNLTNDVALELTVSGVDKRSPVTFGFDARIDPGDASHVDLTMGTNLPSPARLTWKRPGIERPVSYVIGRRGPWKRLRNALRALGGRDQHWQ